MNWAEPTPARRDALDLSHESTVSNECLEAILGQLSEVLPLTYAQWVIESPAVWDYRVMVSRSPAGADCYDIAHRSGVIGQVFRRERPIFIPDARTHPLYDVYDPLVEWELALPLRDKGALVSVLNLEGGGNLEISGVLWQQLRKILFSETGLQLSEGVPKPGEAWMVKTTCVRISGTTEPAADAALRLGRAAAGGGLSVLIAGALNLPASSIYPTIEEALATDVSLGGCFRGGGRRLDLLQVGVSGALRAEETPWWSLADGRYDFVLLARGADPKEGALGDD
jgi:hypothetical protein